jgi:hypothetical protein
VDEPMEQQNNGKAEHVVQLVERVLLKYAPLLAAPHDPECFKEKSCLVELPLLCTDPFAIWSSLRLSYMPSAS